MKTVKVEVCRGTSCHLLGSQDLIEAVESLPADRREQIDLGTVDCLKCCRQGPNVRIDGTVFSEKSSEQLRALLDEQTFPTGD